MKRIESTNFRYLGTYWLQVRAIRKYHATNCRTYSIKYGVELIPFEIRSLSPTINIAHEENLDFKTGQQHLISPFSGYWATTGSWRFQIQCYRLLLIMFQVRNDVGMEFFTRHRCIQDENHMA